MKILIIKPSSLGDVIHALPFLKAVYNTFPDAKIDWVINKNLVGIVEDNPLINRIFIIDKDSWKSIKKIPQTLSEILSFSKALKSEHYDMAVDLQGLLRSGLIALSTSTKTKIGFANSQEGSRFFYDKKVSVDWNTHAVDRCLEIARSIGARTGKVEFPLQINDSARNKVRRLIGDIDKYIVIVPSTRWRNKRWPIENFSSLIKRLSVPCVITGSKGDMEIAQKITNLSLGNIIDLCGKTGLKELIALIAEAKVVVTNDSGPMHIAVALDIPVIALFGPTDPVRTGPYGWQDNEKLKVLRANVPCSPCFKKKCKEPICMNNISVESVFAALKEYL